MKSIFYPAAFAALSYAAVLKRDQCCFQLTATGGVSGVMGQLDDGQNRLNGTYSAATYCFSNGSITDANGRGCIVTTTNDATHQFQCDEGTAAQAGFSISANGSLSFDSSDQFYACPYNNGDITEYNVYTQELAGQDKCRPISLSTGGKCSTSGSTCSMATTTVYATAAALPSLQSLGGYSSAFSAITPENPVSAPSATQYTPTMEVVPTPESTLVSVTAPAYSTISQNIISASSIVEASMTAYETSVSQVANSPVAPVAYSSVATVPAYSSHSQATTSSYRMSLEIPVIASTYSAAPSTWMISTSILVASTSAASSAPIYLSMPSSAVAPVPVYNTSSKAITSTWATIVSVPASTSIPATTSVSATTSSIVVASSYPEASTTVATTSTSASVCQTALTGAYQTPHLIVSISSSSPDTAYGTQYDAYIDSENSTIFNFDIPSSYEGMTCTTIFLFPEIADLETSSYTLSGSGDLVFSELSTAATEETTYNTAPSVTSVLDTIAIASGNSYVVASGSCSAGATVSIELSSQNGLSLEFFEDWNPSSLGLYITAC